MYHDKPEWIAHQREYWTRPDADRWLRPDAHRWMGPEAQKWLLPDRKPRLQPQPDEHGLDLADEREWLRRTRQELASLKAELKFRQFFRSLKAGFRHDQPRVPAGNPDGGRWTREAGVGRTQLAGGGRLPIGPGAAATIAIELALRLIDAYRSENGLWDLFGRRLGTVAATTIDGVTIYGSNSKSPSYTDADFREAERLRDALAERYPDLIPSENIGQTPADALFHAEATVLLRAARSNGGTLAGREIEVFVDRPMCWSCRTLLPFIGLELGNPTITFVDPSGRRMTMRDGMWIR